MEEKQRAARKERQQTKQEWKPRCYVCVCVVRVCVLCLCVCVCLYMCVVRVCVLCVLCAYVRACTPYLSV